MPFNPFKKGDWDKLGKQTKNEFSKIERALRDVGEDVKVELRKLGADCRNGVRAMGREVEDGLRKSANEIKDGFEKELPALAEAAARDAVAAIMAEAAKGTFTKAVDVAQVLAPDTMGIKIGPVGMTIGNVKDRIDTLQRWANNPPRSKADIKECIITLAPTSVSVEVDVQFALLVVSSDALEVGFSAEWETASFIEKFDDIIAHF